MMYLVTHPFRQYFEKKDLEADYFEQKIVDSMEYTANGAFTSLSPMYVQKVIMNLSQLVKKMASSGQTPIVLTATSLRPHFKRIIDRSIPSLVCLAYNEIDPKVEIQSIGMVDFIPEET